jgi:hypothetical protein
MELTGTFRQLVFVKQIAVILIAGFFFLKRCHLSIRPNHKVRVVTNLA